MPKNKKPAGGRPAKNFEPRYGAKKSGGPSAGSRSPGHRGYRPESTEAPRKNRWSNEDRDARRGAPAGERPAYGDRVPRGDRNERPAYNRGERSGRPAYGDRTERPRYERSERASYGDRAPRSDRPAYGERSERPSFNRGDRNERPAYNRGERPAYGDRTERPRYDRDGARAERAPYGDRAPRSDRPSYGDRNDRPAYNRGERTERPRYERSERPAYGDRAPRGERAYDRSDRGSRNFGGERPRWNKDEAPRRSHSDFYPSKDEKPRFSPEDDVVLERLEAQATTAADVDGITFADLGLGGNICRQLSEMGATAPFPIQAATIPDVLAGKDVLGRGKTGSGKTIAFGSPVVERLMENNGGKDRKHGRAARALILAPTRELAMQIDRTVQPIARCVGLFTTTIFGGVPQHKQVMSLRRGVDIIIATPGRLEDLVEQGHIDLGHIAITVLDEADHMCDLGFLEPVQRILRATKADGQRLLFSATLDKGVAAIVNEFLKDPSVHEVAGEDQASSTIDHRVLVVDHRDKPFVIEQLAAREGKTLIFSRTRAYAEQLADQLEDAGIPATSLHGDLNQNRRTRNLQLLTSGRVNVLVATDVAARGIHVDDIDLVIQADAPDEYKTYMHRAGRTGRAGKQGTVVTIIPRTRQRRMNDLLGRAEIEAEMVPASPGDELLQQLASANA
ncbi:DEAD/DEAH box helicase [Aurantimicrobium minutum]|uniref:DEAD/DEAH box helicase n=1 Tax=Aurantimicrobium minutum TaxID=708131 RepID=UPI0024731614|nr:DEAD/DEAH box helicase [Aurantimicrobium minutum]MDH6240123.1 superfamily II DNA/RNA helicase [Aurantimicrobium minutum]